MMALSRPEVILTHESDLDGFVSGLLLKRLARRLYDVEVPLEAFHNHTWRQRPLPERVAWVCDFSFESRLDRADWVVIDHHPTNRTPTQAQLIHDPKKSASLLCYELCRQHEIENPDLDRLVHLSNVADLFLVDEPDFDVANDYANLVKTYQFWNLHDLIGGRIESLLDHPLLEVMAVKRRVENPLGLAWSKSNIIGLSPTVGFVETVVGNTNLIVHNLLSHDAPAFPVLVTLFRKGNGTVIASLRSRNGEALPVASVLQGGGHPNASGATLPRAVQSIPDAIEYLKRTLNPSTKEPEIKGLEHALADLEGAGS